MKNFLQISKPSCGPVFLWPVVAAYASQNDTKFLEELCTRWYQTNSEWATILSEKDFFFSQALWHHLLNALAFFTGSGVKNWPNLLMG